MNFIELNADIRKKTGNGPARALRRRGKIPAVFYGPQTDSVLLSIDMQTLEKRLKDSARTGQMLFKLEIDDKAIGARTAMLKELQTHPVSKEFLHADFYEVDMKRKINVNIPVQTTGKSPGVERGGLLQMVRRELEIYCLPGKIPEFIEVDINTLDIGDSLHIDEVSLAEDVEVVSDINFTVVTVVAPKTEAIAEEESEDEDLIELDVDAAEPDSEE